MENKQFLVLFIACSSLCFVYGTVRKVTIEPRNGPVWFVKGTPLMLTCIVHTDEKVDIVWSRDGIQLSGVEYRIDSWAAVDSYGPAQFVKITKMVALDQDQATFRCFAKGVDETTQTSMFQMSTSGANISEGHNSTLTCQTDLQYTAKQVTWYKADRPLDEITDLRRRIVLGRDNYTVTFLNTKLTDGGVYTCRVEINPDTEFRQIFQERVALQGKPYISHQGMHKMDEGSTHKSIVLKCRVNGYPVPNVLWKKADAFTESSEKFQITFNVQEATSQLKINNPTGSDYDQYTCIAQNMFGKDNFTFYVMDSGAANLAFKLVLYDCTIFKVNFYLVAAMLVLALTK